METPEKNLSERLLTALTSDETSVAWRTMIREVSDITPEGYKLVETYTLQRIEAICASIRDLTVDGDAGEVKNILPGLWLELRFEWNRYNAQLQYQCVLTGIGSPALMARSGVLSFLAGTVESFLSPYEQYWSLKLAAAPLVTASAREATTSHFMQYAAQVDHQIQSMVELLFSARELGNLLNVNQRLLDHIDSIVEQGVEGVVRQLALSTDDLQNSLEALVVKHLHNAGVTAVVEMSECSSGLILLPETVGSLLGIAEKWLAQLFATSVEKTVSERLQSGRCAHLNIRWSILQTEGELLLRIVDDGMGLVPRDLELDSKRMSRRGFSISFKNSESGSKLEVRVDLRLVTNQEYLVCTIGDQDSMVAVSVANVEYITRRSAGELNPQLMTFVQEGRPTVVTVDLNRHLGGAAQTNETVIAIRKDQEVQRAVLVREALYVQRARLKPNPAFIENDFVSGLIDLGGALIPVVNIESVLSADCGQIMELRTLSKNKQALHELAMPGIAKQALNDSF